MVTAQPRPLTSSAVGGPAQRRSHTHKKRPEQSLALPQGPLRDPAHPHCRADVQTDLPTQKATGARGGWGKQTLMARMLQYVVMAVDGSDGLRPSKDGHLASIRGAGTPVPCSWRQHLWACGRGSPLCGRWGLVTGAGLQEAGGGRVSALQLPCVRCIPVSPASG